MAHIFPSISGDLRLLFFLYRLFEALLVVQSDIILTSLRNKTVVIPTVLSFLHYSNSIVEFFHSFESLVFQRFTQFISERFLPFDCIFVKFGCHLVVTDIIRVAPCSRSLKAEGGSLTHIFSTSN